MDREAAQTRKYISVEPILLIRLICAAIGCAAAAFFSLPFFVRIVLLLLAAGAAGYDVALSAVDAFERREYFSAPVAVLFAVVLSFVIGYALEGAATMLIYRAGLIILDYVIARTKASALELIDSSNEGIAAQAAELIETDGATDLSVGSMMYKSSALVLKIAMALAVVYAVVIPLFTNCTFTRSLHRALIVIAISTPASIIVSIPSVASVGSCLAAGEGIIAGKTATLEKLSDIKTILFDKCGVLSDAIPRVVSAEAKLIDRQTFIVFAAHAAYYSNQPFAKAVTALYNKAYKLDVISDFVDIPGVGVDLLIGGTHVTLARRDLFSSRGVSVPVEKTDGNRVYYMTVADRYVGKLEFSDSVKEDCADIVQDCMELGVRKCILLTEDSREDGVAFAEELGFNGLFALCDEDKKLRCVEETADGAEGGILYVYAQNDNCHSAAGIDIRVGNQSKYADAVILPDCVGNLPLALQLSRRIVQIATFNSASVFAVKALIIFLALSGLCNMWFAMLLDVAAAAASVLYSIRTADI